MLGEGGGEGAGAAEGGSGCLMGWGVVRLLSSLGFDADYSEDLPVFRGSSDTDHDKSHTGNFKNGVSRRDSCTASQPMWQRNSSPGRFSLEDHQIHFTGSQLLLIPTAPWNSFP